MDDFTAACYADLRDRGYDDARARELAPLAKARYEAQRGPWLRRSPEHKMASAVNRLQSLKDHAAEYGAEEIIEVVHDIAEHMDADTFRDVARRFGVESGSTKGEMVEEVIKAIGKDQAE